MPKPAPLFYELSAGPELGALLATAPWLATAPRGRGNRVLVIPGFTAGDLTTAPLRAVLRALGHRPAGWGLGANIGPDDNTVRMLMRRVDELVERKRGPNYLVVWSLGGNIIRHIALYRPHDVRQVISMGSPIRVEDPEANLSDAVRIVAQMAGLQRDRATHDLTHVPVPSTAIFSRGDGIVAPSSCQQPPGPTAENVEVRGAHIGLAHNPTVVWTVADRLAWADGDPWRPFEPPARLGCLFPSTTER